MSHEYFLVERAAQIQRLQAAESGPRIDIPGRLARLGCSPRTAQVFRMIDQICEIPLVNERQKGWAALRARGENLLRSLFSKEQHADEPKLLSAEQQALMRSFDRELVQLRLSDDRDGASTAETIITAILQDGKNFFGLKPLAFHAENFPYEFLFPSWLNLYTALVLPKSKPQGVQFSEPQIRTIFEFLARRAPATDQVESELIAAITLITRRLPLPEAQPLVQRILDLGSCKTSSATHVAAPAIRRIHENSPTATDLLAVLKAAIFCDACLHCQESASPHRVTPDLLHYSALPAPLAAKLRQLREASNAYSDWAQLVRRVGQVQERVGGFDREFTALMELPGQEDHAADLLALVAPDEHSATLPMPAQRYLARMVRRVGVPHNGADAETIQAFARHVAPRLAGLDEATGLVFEEEFVQKNEHREVLLRAAGAEDKRRKVSQQLLALARKTEDGGRMLSRLFLAAALDPDCEDSKLKKISITLHTLRQLQDQGFITWKQFHDLTSDVRRRLPGSLDVLAQPQLGAASDSDRIAGLYLALNEQRMTYELTGAVGNFSVSRAAFSNLNRAGEGRVE